MAVIFELFLDRIRVVANGRTRNEGVNALAAILHYPRENVPSITAVRSLYGALADEAVIDYTRQPFHRRLLFKESLRGSSMLELVLSSTTRASKLDTFLHRMLGSAWAAGMGTLTAGMGTLPKALLSRASVSLFDLAKPSDEITIIGKGYFPIYEGMSQTRIPVQLTLPKPLHVQKTEERAGKPVLVQRTYPAGFGNAEVTIQVKRLVSG